MTWAPGADAFWVLYLVNVFQPISEEQLAEEARRLWKEVRRGQPEPQVRLVLTELENSGLVIRQQNGEYAVTLVGLERLSIFKLGHIRDKNRLFLLKERFKAR